MVMLLCPAVCVMLASAEGGVHMPFSDSVKYSILGVSIALLLVALAILAWQALRYYRQSCVAPQEEAVDGDLLDQDHSSTKDRRRAGSSFNKVDEVSKKVAKLGRRLSQASFCSSVSGATDLDCMELTSIAKVDGTLHFNVHYDPLQCCLKVSVLELEGLQEVNQNPGQKIFVKLKLLWVRAGGAGLEHYVNEEGGGAAPVLCSVLREWRTRIVTSSCSCLFGDQFSCFLQDEKELHHLTLRMEVKDINALSRNAVLGQVRLPLEQLSLSSHLELQKELQVPQKDLVGEVLLSLKFMPTSQRLEVGLLKVRTSSTEICSEAVLYARITVQCNQLKLRYQKTSAVQRSVVTVFNDVRVFFFPEFPVEQCKILVSVYEIHATRKSNKHLIGQTTVGKDQSLEDVHWRLMMRCVRQPVARWHGLLI
ncbi:synaptotagmin-2 [Synchiropus splendidus]|uniref:synaptotagmin-2 n=1 Tax=Synchiropus splendidus TaxID=270530 RepID=UPI00237E6113|nr:synaptotagmin-2 [Synchiropus splendidus]XP_053740793.1 synaptotagmin-2 [Synchiropus splendidus]